MKHPFNIEKINKSVFWAKEEDKLLISLVSIHGRRWSSISINFNGKTAQHCNLRYCSINPSNKKGAWEPFEDKKIIEGVKNHSNHWSRIAKAFFTNRTGKQVRDRYINYLDPKINKGKFSTEEDLQILELYNKYGSKWCLIKQFLPGRSSDCIKNRFNSSIKRNKKLCMMINSQSCNIVSV
jgi:hypothetical protein